MTRLVWTILGSTFSICLWAAQPPGTISGTVRDGAGVVQMGARVEVFSAVPSMTAVRASGNEAFSVAVNPIATAVSDANGFFELADLAAGAYSIRVTSPSFLPTLRQDLDLTSGATLVVDVTLKTLADLIQMLPTRRRTAADADDWKWTLRSAANRPILRLLDEDAKNSGCTLIVDEDILPGNENSADGDCLSEPDSSGIPFTGAVAMVGGSEADGFGSSPDMTTVFRMERSIFSSGTIALGGNVNYGGEGITPGTVLSASYARHMADGSEPLVAFTLRRFATPDMIAHDAALQALSVSAADHITVGEFLDLGLGTEYQTVQFMGRVSAVRPNGTADFHLSPNTLLEYR